MRKALRLAIAFSGASIFGAAVLLACSDDTSVNASTEAGVVPGPDSSFDSPPAEDASDGGADTSVPFDGGFQVETFDAVLASEVCKSLARCCFGSTMPAEGGADGGTFDLKQCEDSYGRLGFETSNADNGLKDGGKVVLNQVSADSCINKVKAMTCNLPGPEFQQIRAACYAAYTGTGAAGAACQASIECQPGFFCKVAADAGAGVCTGVRPLNGPCGDLDPNRADEACSYRAGGNTGDYCNFYDFTAGAFLDAGDWKCAAARGAGNDCATSLWCAQTICDFDTLKCKTPDQYFDPACTSFVH